MKFPEPEIPIELLTSHSRLGHVVEDISLLWPPLPGKAIKLFLSTSPQTLSLGYDQCWSTEVEFSLHPPMGQHRAMGDPDHPFQQAKPWVEWHSESLCMVLWKHIQMLAFKEHFTVYLSELEQGCHVHPVVPKGHLSQELPLALGKRAQHTH